MGKVALRDGRVQDAIAHWEAALLRDPDNNLIADQLDYFAPGTMGLIAEYAPDDAAIEAAVRSEVESLPDANVVALMDDEIVDIGSDGSARRLVTRVSRVVNETGRDQLIKTHLPGRGRVKLLRSWVLAPDGSRQEASSVRGKVVRFPRLTVGSVVILQYLHTARPRTFLPEHYAATWDFEGFGTQIVRSRWVVIEPPGKKLSVDIQREVMSRKEERDGRVVHVFESESVPPAGSEPMMPPYQDHIRRVRISTVPSWDEIVRWERALLAEVFYTDEAIRSLAVELTAGVSAPRERLDRLYRFVAQEVRYQQDYEDNIAGVRPHTCSVVLARGYGDCKDKAVLLIALAAEIGIDVDFAILRTRPKGKLVAATPDQQFNHAIAYVPAQSGIEQGFFLDPTTDGLDMGNLRSDDQGATSLVLDPGTGKWSFIDVPFQAPAFQSERRDLIVRLNAEGATASADIRFGGDLGSTLRQTLRNEAMGEQVHNALANMLFPGSRVLSSETTGKDDIWEPLVIHLELDISAAITDQGDARSLAIPGVLPITKTAMLEKRQYPLALGVPREVIQSIRVEAGAGVRLVHLPGANAVETDCFDFTIEPLGADEVATIETRYEQRCTEIAPKDFPAFRDAVVRGKAASIDPLLFSVD